MTTEAGCDRPCAAVRPDKGISVSHVRAAVLTNFDPVARFVGLDPDTLLGAAGLDATLLDDPDRLVPAPAIKMVLEDSARISGYEQIGLLMGESRSLGSIGPVSLAMAHEPSLGTIIEALVRHQRQWGDAFQIKSVTIDDLVFLRVDTVDAHPSRQGMELIIALFCRCIALILDRRWSPEGIQFVHSAPRDMRVHDRLFGCPIDFNSDANGIVVTRASLQEPNPAGDAELALHAERLLGLLTPRAAIRSTTERVRQSVRLLLPENRAALDIVARDIGTTPRSLQRQLRREGQSFAGLLDDVRRDLAQQYLAASRSMTDIALALGYNSSGSFARWFKTQFGIPPLEWRQTISGGDAAS